MTDPTTMFFPIDNPVPKDYSIHGQIYNPSGKIDPSPGPIGFDILYEVAPEGTAVPTGIWQKNLWRFEFNDTKWAGVNPYPYTMMPKDQSITLMYMGLPGNKYADPPEPINSRVDYHVKMYTDLANETGAEYPIITSSQAWDTGILISNGYPHLTGISHTHGVVEYRSTPGNTPVAKLYMNKGSPFVNVECMGAQIGMGSTIRGVPPIIEINGKPPGSTITASSFVVKVAVGPNHLQGEMWNWYFDKAVTLSFPAGSSPPTLTALYTGLLQVAAGEVDNKMKPLLDKYRGVYSTATDISYDIDDDNNKLTINFNWNKKVSPSAPGTDLLMLAIRHHTDIINLGPGQSTSNTSWWCVKGPMDYIVGDTWALEYPLTTSGFGEHLSVDAKYLPTLKAQLQFDYNLYIDECPGDNAEGQGRPGNENMEFYAYMRGLTKYIDIAIAATSIGETEMAANMTAHVAQCMLPANIREEYAPQPCPPAINGTATCVRNQLKTWYDKTYGGIITGWYNRFAILYCEECKNVYGYYPLANYGNTLYNDHHFQYGYYVKNAAWILYQKKQGVDVGLTDKQLEDLRLRALVLARDYANSNTTDKYFTQLRHKDLYEGHSWAEGYDYNGYVFTWNNQEGGGEAINSYYALYLLGLALDDKNLADWGRVNLASEIVSIRKYQHLTQEEPDIPYGPMNDMLRCMPMLQGNGATGTTYYGPQALFDCGAGIIPFTQVTKELVAPLWAGEAYDWMLWHQHAGGVCIYPDPINNATNVCPGRNGGNWWGNEWACCPFDLAGFESNLWTAYPNWYPIMFLIQAFNDTASAWGNLQVQDLYKPTELLPFPYMNNFSYAVGYEPGLSRTHALWIIGTGIADPHRELPPFRQPKHAAQPRKAVRTGKIRVE